MSYPRICPLLNKLISLSLLTLPSAHGEVWSCTNTVLLPRGERDARAPCLSRRRRRDETKRECQTCGGGERTPLTHKNHRNATEQTREDKKPREAAGENGRQKEREVTR